MLLKKIGISIVTLIATGTLGALCFVFLRPPLSYSHFLSTLELIMILPILTLTEELAFTASGIVLFTLATAPLVWWIYLMVFSHRKRLLVFPIIIWVSIGCAELFYFEFLSCV